MASPVLATDPTGRFEIRQLTSEHTPWASAIVMHCNGLHSPIWPTLYPELANGKVVRDKFRTVDYLMQHQIDSGMSFGVFDTQYPYKNPASRTSGGKLRWDEAADDATGEQLLDLMDGPLVSIAMAYDLANPLDYSQMTELLETLPAFGHIYHCLDDVLDKRPPETWKTSVPGEVLMRNATATRQDYTGKGLMKWLAQFLMRTAAERGYKAINIEAFHDAVEKVWMNPPAPFKAEQVASFELDTWEEENENGKKTKPFIPAKQKCSKIFVHLK